MDDYIPDELPYEELEEKRPEEDTMVGVDKLNIPDNAEVIGGE